MLLTRLKLLLRLLREQPGIYSLKLLSLAIAFACSILVISFASREFNVNSGQQSSGEIFRVLRRNNAQDYDRIRLTDRIPPAIKNQISRVGADTLISLSRVKVLEQITAQSEGRSIAGIPFHSAESSISDVFDFNFVGDQNALTPDRQAFALISVTASETLFGSRSSAGRSFSVATIHDTIRVLVAGVFEDWKNAHEEFNVFLVSSDEQIRSLGYDADDFGLYARLSTASLSDTLGSIVSHKAHETNIAYSFQSLNDIHFGARVMGESARHGDAYSVWILICISSLIALLAISNYANLTTLTLPARSTELAISKVAGAESLTVGIRLVQESVALSFVALMSGIALLAMASPILEKYFSIEVDQWLANAEWGAAALLLSVFLATLAAPLYPVIVFASAGPRRLLSAEVISFPKFKRAITTFQLGISISLIVAGLVIERQIDRSLIKEPGRNHDQVVYLKYPKEITRLDDIKLGWKRYNPNIVEVTAASQLPNNLQSKDPTGSFYKIAIEHDFFTFFDIKVNSGRTFRVNDQDSVMSNAAGLATGVGRKAIGVVGNFASKFNQPERPLQITQSTDYAFLFIRILEVNVRDTQAYLHRFFKMITPEEIRLTFLDSRYAAVMKYEDTLNGLSRLLTTVGIVMACCAILALSLSRLNDNLKQIAIRRTFGASRSSIIMLMSREFIEELLAAVLLFGPITFLLLRAWLKNFVYAAHMHWSDPLLGLIACLVIIFLVNSSLIFNLGKNATANALRR